MGRGESIGINGGTITSGPIDVSRGLLAHGQHAMAGIESVGKTPPFILDTSAHAVSTWFIGRLRLLVLGSLTAERTSWHGRREQAQRAAVARELGHNP